LTKPSSPKSAKIKAANTPQNVVVNVKVGTLVRLKKSIEEFKTAFVGTPYAWQPAMVALLGTEQTVVEVPQTGYFGLPEAQPRSGQPVWYYPTTVIQEVVITRLKSSMKKVAFADSDTDELSPREVATTSAGEPIRELSLAHKKTLKKTRTGTLKFSNDDEDTGDIVCAYFYSLSNHSLTSSYFHHSLSHPFRHTKLT